MMHAAARPLPSPPGESSFASVGWDDSDVREHLRMATFAENPVERAVPSGTERAASLHEAVIAWLEQHG